VIIQLVGFCFVLYVVFGILGWWFNVDWYGGWFNRM